MTTQQKNTTADAGQNREPKYRFGFSRQFKKTEWQAMEIVSEPTATMGQIRQDQDGDLWLWKSSGLRVTAMALAATTPAKPTDAHAAGAHTPRFTTSGELIAWLQEAGSLQFDPSDPQLETVCRDAIQSVFTTAAERDYFAKANNSEQIRNRKLQHELGETAAERDQAREQVKTLATVLGNLIGKIEEMSGCMPVNYEQGNEECYPEFDAARNAIAAVEIEGQ